MKRIVSLVILLLSFNYAHANLDGYRQGFMIGFGGGLQHTRLDYDSSNHLNYTPAPGQTARYKSHESKTNIATTLKLGWGIVDQFAVQYLAYSAWYKSRNNTPVFSHKSWLANTFHGLGVSYYFSKDAPSFYITAGAGKAYMRSPFENHPKKDGGDTKTSAHGEGVLVSLGWEIVQRQSLELTYIKSEFDDLKSNSGNANIDSRSFMFTYNYLFY